MGSDDIIGAVWMTEKGHPLKFIVFGYQPSRVEVVFAKPRETGVLVIARPDKVRFTIDRVLKEAHIKGRDSLCTCGLACRREAGRARS